MLETPNESNARATGGRSVYRCRKRVRRASWGHPNFQSGKEDLRRLRARERARASIAFRLAARKTVERFCCQRKQFFATPRHGPRAVGESCGSMGPDRLARRAWTSSTAAYRVVTMKPQVRFKGQRAKGKGEVHQCVRCRCRVWASCLYKSTVKTMERRARLPTFLEELGKSSEAVPEITRNRHQLNVRSVINRIQWPGTEHAAIPC
jgi:hypothetical protein